MFVPAGFQGDKGQSRSLVGRIPSAGWCISVVLCSSGVLFKENHIFLLGLYHRSLTQQKNVIMCVKVACLHNLLLNGSLLAVSRGTRQQMRYVYQMCREVLHNPSFAPSPIQHSNISYCVVFLLFSFFFIIISDYSSTICLSTPHPGAGN